MRLMRNRTTAVVAGAAAIVALSATGSIAGQMIGSAQIQDDSVRSIDIKDETIRAKDLRPGAVATLQGEDGKDGKDGVSGLEYVTYDYIKDIGHRPGHDGADAGYVGAGAGGIATVACPEGKTAIGGGVQFLGLDGDNGQPAVTNDNGVVDSFPGRMDWNTNTPKVDRYDGWIVRLNKNAAGEPISVWAVCVNK